MISETLQLGTMPSYELTMILRKMSHPSTVSAIKAAAQEIYSSGGFIRKMESMGERQLPNKKKVKGIKHSEGTYFLMDVDVMVSSLPKIEDELNRNKDIIQQQFLAKERLQAEVECPKTLNQERLPPAERPSIQQLLEQGRRPPRFKKIFDPKTGLDYYPFHR